MCLTIDLSQPGSGCCDRCHGGPGVMLEDDTGSQKAFCLSCLAALLLAALPTLNTVGVES
jgi:hypothetical protein